MAKRYARLNWQNRPNVATPLSAANLNKMDKGIDDCDNAIEEIYAKRVNNVVTTNTDTFLAGPVGKTLQDQITTINNNLVNLLFNQPLESVSSNYTDANDLPAGIVFSGTKLTNQPNNTHCMFITIVTAGSKTQIAISTRGDETGNIYRRNYASGSWTSWYKFTGTVV